MTDRDIVVISSIDWGPLWQSPQEVASRFAAAGNRVLFIENTGVRRPGLRDARRVLRRLRSWGGGDAGHTDDRAGVEVVSPLVLPALGGPANRAINRRVFLPAIRRRATRLGFRDPIVITWLPTDTALDVADLLALPRRTLVYFCIADFEPLTPRVARLRQTEAELLRRADLVLAHTPAFRERCERHSSRVHLLPPSVNMQAFPLAPVPEARPSAPTIGYIGGVHAVVDLELVAACARARPAWRWVLVGPIQRSTAAVEGLPNVELLGAVPHGDLGSHVAGFDVCIVPYGHSDASTTVAPTKINEYLAVGKPVVASDLPWVVEFQRRHRVLEVAPPDSHSFVAAIEHALDKASDPAAAERRRGVAALSDWTARLEHMGVLLEGLEGASGAAV
jgi:glycosyltransferase involved in cell wall biosynthesis